MESIVAVVAAKQLNLKLLMVKLDYITNILPQTGWPAKFTFRLKRGSKWAKSAIFAIFSLIRIYPPTYLF